MNEKVTSFTALTFIECDGAGYVLAAGVGSRSSSPGGCTHLPATEDPQLHPLLETVGGKNSQQ